ncbi:hypothetical protein EBI_25654 [Enterocytozoon bieneusi H348]|nr:hypothetical protein EBI_25654 [Enterocytozoon bieneusi H348]|eukprot:XP_002651115.1 hypothetical protein EBI_25654 [Enterocytozoon bieneusi H348]
MPTYQQILIVIGNKLHGQIEMSTSNSTRTSHVRTCRMINAECQKSLWWGKIEELNNPNKPAMTATLSILGRRCCACGVCRVTVRERNRAPPGRTGWLWPSGKRLRIRVEDIKK